jgi:hypothetical protein
MKAWSCLPERVRSMEGLGIGALSMDVCRMRVPEYQRMLPVAASSDKSDATFALTAAR